MQIDKIQEILGDICHNDTQIRENKSNHFYFLKQHRITHYLKYIRLHNNAVKYTIEIRDK